MTEQLLQFLLAVTVSQTLFVLDDLDRLRNNDQVLGRVSLSWELPGNFLLKINYNLFFPVLLRY